MKSLFLVIFISLTLYNSAAEKDPNEKLFTAAITGDLDDLRQLVSKGADINVKSKYGRNVLMVAAEYANTDVVKYLLAKGAEINTHCTRQGMTVLMCAIRINVAYYYKKIDMASIKKKAAEMKKESINVVQCLIENGVDIEARDKRGRTALMYAAEHNNLAVAKYLIEKGADVNFKNKYGKTALSLAREKEIKDLLLKHGSNQ